LSTINPLRTKQESNPDLCYENMESNSLNYGTSYENVSPSRLNGFKNPVVHLVVTLFIGRATRLQTSLQKLAFELT